MKAAIQSNDKEFLEQALKFYKNIDRYSAPLEIDGKELDAFKNDIKILLFISNKHYRSFTESFVRYNITILRIRLEGLFMACTTSKNYRKKTGIELGIITPRLHVEHASGFDSFDTEPHWLAHRTIK
jgi:hypothetical protein